MASSQPETGFIAFNRQRLVQYFFFGVFLLLLHQVLRMLAPFYLALVGSSLLALMVYPVHARVLRLMPRHPSLAATLSAAMTLLGIVLPVLGFGWVFMKDTGSVYPAAREWLEGLRGIDPASWQSRLPPQARVAWERARDFLQFWHIDLQEILLRNLDALSAAMSGLATTLIRNTIFVLFNLLLLAFTLFFFLRDGPFMIGRLTELVPMAPEHKRVILDRAQDTVFAVIRGVLVISAVQGFMAGVGLALFGVPFPVLLGTMTAFVAPIPFIGIGAVMVPLVLSLTITGALRQALYVALWAVFVVGLIDNVLRPILISAQAKLPILLLFFGILGGLRVYGVAGVLVGPLLVALVLVFINIYRQEYRWLIEDLSRNADD